MRLSRAVLVTMALLASSLMAVGPAHAHEWPEKPRLEDYRDYDEFVRAMAVYRKLLRSGDIQPPLTIRITVPSSPTMTELSFNSAEMNDPLSEDYPPPITVTGPENLEEAVEKAKGFIHPVYLAKLRYNRSTSQSFPLAHAANRVLSESAIADLLFGQMEPGDPQRLLQALINQDEMLSVERAGTYGERIMDLRTQSAVLQPTVFAERSALMRVGMPEGVIESFHR